MLVIIFSKYVVYGPIPEHGESTGYKYIHLNPLITC